MIEEQRELRLDLEAYTSHLITICQRAGSEIINIEYPNHFECNIYIEPNGPTAADLLNHIQFVINLHKYAEIKEADAERIKLVFGRFKVSIINTEPQHTVCCFWVKAGDRNFAVWHRNRELAAAMFLDEYHHEVGDIEKFERLSIAEGKPRIEEKTK
jgi:hypothetical protein